MSLVDIHIQEFPTKNDYYYDELNMQLPDNDHIKSRCGEIFISSRKILIFVCTECKENFFCYEDFFAHLSEEHISTEEDLKYEDATYEEVIDENSMSAIEDELDDEIKPTAIVDLSPEEKQKKDDEDLAEGLNKELLETFERIDEYEEALEESETYEPEDYLGSCSVSIDEVCDPSDEKKLPKNTVATPKKILKNVDAFIARERTNLLLPTPTTSLFECPSCPEKFKIEFDLKTHLKFHEAKRKYKCEICGFRFTLLSNLRAHVRRHIGEKQFACDECEKHFWTTSELNTHRRKHTGERPYICELCGSGFKTSGALTDHEKRHTQKKRHKCSECDRKFLHLKVLREHMNTHTLDRPFICKVCNATFSRKHSLTQHLCLHNTEKMYICEICSKDFAQLPGLLAHKKLHELD